MVTLTRNEKQFAADHKFVRWVKRGDVRVDWELINHGTDSYAEMLKEFDFAAIVGSMVDRYGKRKALQVMPMAGNIGLEDKELGFDAFMNHLSHLKRTKQPSKVVEKELGEKSEAMVTYLLTGKHSDKEMVFPGLLKSVAAARKAKKTACLGIVSVDIPHTIKDKKGIRTLIPSGTQHYVAYVYELATNKLYLFDSAAKNPITDKSEVYYILKRVFEGLEGSLAAASNAEGRTKVTVAPVAFPYTLQPGAGDVKGEDDISYNNQNVFCHTWSIWFCALCAMFYEADKGMVDLLPFFKKLAHKDEMLNLAMIKRFAHWLSSFLVSDPEDEAQSKQSPKAPKAAFMKAFPLEGLKYVWCYKNKKAVLINELCIAGKVKLDIKWLDEELDEYNVREFMALMKVPRHCSEKM